jgi:hypothetical protein
MRTADEFHPDHFDHPVMASTATVVAFLVVALLVTALFTSLAGVTQPSF